tara:strand:+ start:1959 stop:2606 length:648 start_codon:yes stop_codon:yes gene_type:complete
MHDSVSNLLRIKEEINLKDSKNYRIIAVSKTFGEEKILPLIDFGHIDFGENKVQEALLKWSTIKGKFKNIKLHMVGKLQTNKVKHAIKIFDYIHSLDNFKLAKKISVEQKKINKNLKLLIQVNIGDEHQKNGLNQNEVKNFLEVCKKDLKLNIVGLMCIPPNEIEPEKYFSEMMKMKQELNLEELSMGMSNDYLSAINHGSTMIRVGSKIFGQRS